jgi:hypothetical protein
MPSEVLASSSIVFPFCGVANIYLFILIQIGEKRSLDGVELLKKRKRKLEEAQKSGKN